MHWWERKLPSDCTEAAVVHARLKDEYVAELQRCQIARRPWVWGAGDSSASSSSVSHNSDLQLAVNITRDQRIDMINSNGMSMGDDEIRFHVIELTRKQPGQHLPPHERQFLPMEPLIFNCWDSIGQVIAKQWSDKNPQVLARGQNVVSAVAVDGHWLPIWMVPAGNTLQVHTFQSTVDFGPIETILGTISTQMGFQDVVIHRIPDGLPDHSMCGALAMNFLAHIIMEMPMPETLLDLRYTHTNMRASFVAHLYGLEYTPKPVIWGTGSPRESGQLPRMPEEEDTRTTDSQSRARRTQMLVSHSYAMGDDEIQFHLSHLVDCFSHGPRPVGPNRRFVPIPIRELAAWTQGDITALDDWKREVWIHTSPDVHIVMVLLLEQCWVPVWFAPMDETFHCHTLSNFASDDAQLDMTIRHLAASLGRADIVIHKVPHGLDVTRLCGTMSICFLAHIMLRTRLPSDVHELRSRCWDMKTVFAEALQNSPPCFPLYWGWGQWESRLLPRMPEENRFEVLHSEVQLHTHGQETPAFGMAAPLTFPEPGMHTHEMYFHLRRLTATSQGCHLTMVVGEVSLLAVVLTCIAKTHGSASIAFLLDGHWQPIILTKTHGNTRVSCEPGVAESLRPFGFTTDLIALTPVVFVESPRGRLWPPFVVWIRCLVLCQCTDGCLSHCIVHREAQVFVVPSILGMAHKGSS